MKINIKKLNENAIIPKYQTNGSIAFDLHTLSDVKWKFVEPNLYEAVINTGLAFEVPECYGMFIFPRSGTGFKYNVHLANGTGLIDSDYRGEIKIKLISIHDSMPPEFSANDRVAQASIIPIIQAKFSEVDELSQTKRGESGFGSTGA